MESNAESKSNIAKKALKIILKILEQILIILCVILTIIIVMQKVTNNNKTIFGYRIFRVITGSMEPAYDVGTVIISKQMSANEIKVGDDIVYLGEYGEYSGKIIMHEVIAIDKDENGNNVNFHAKGLHNSSVEDPQIKANQIFGVVKVNSKILTILYELATSPYSAFIIITILVLNVFVAFKFSKKPKNKEEEEISEEESFDENEAENEAENEDEDQQENIDDDDTEEK